MMKSYETLRKAGIEYKDAPVYIPPYEYYNKEISAWAKNMGIQVINYDPWYHEQCRLHHSGHGTEVPEQQIHLRQDYGGGKERRSERTLDADTLRNGRPAATDKFYNGYLDKMIKTLNEKATLLYRSARLSVYKHTLTRIY